jgi:tetratricopeptide (TPR) repeat protein
MVSPTIIAMRLAPTDPPGYAGGSSGGTLVCLFIGALVLGAGIWMLLRRRTSPKSGDGLSTSSPAPGERHGSVPTEQLANEANALLVGADDALRTSEQELNFAAAQFGPGATKEFTAALEASRADITAAFQRRQLLDDEIPDDEATKRAWYAEIIDRCRTADARLDAQADAFDKLRDLESHLDTLVPHLSVRRDAAAAKLPHVEAVHDDLTRRYARSAVLAISDSTTQARERLDFADRTLAQARAALNSGDRPLAALAVRAIEEALGQIDMIDNGVTRLSSNLDQASATVATALADLESDVAAGRAALSASATAGGSANAGTVDLAAAVAAAEQVAESIRSELSLPDPFAAIRRLEQVGTRLDAALDTIRDAASRVERARQQLDQAIPAARAEVSAVRDFVTTRRGAVGSDARTRLAEAERHLEQALALAETDPVAALAEARRADSLAEQAGQLASDDVDGWAHPGMGSMGGIGGAVLGGILLEGMLGSGRPGGFGGGFGWGGRVPGSFGGPGTRVRIRI